MYHYRPLHPKILKPKSLAQTLVRFRSLRPKAGLGLSLGFSYQTSKQNPLKPDALWGLHVLRWVYGSYDIVTTV